MPTVKWRFGDAFVSSSKTAFTIAGRDFQSRLMVGTGKYKSPDEMVRAIDASGAEVVTVAVRRVNLNRDTDDGVLPHLDPARMKARKPHKNEAFQASLELPADEPEGDSCGSCRACLDICPTAAFPEPYRLDARRCISYLTIEHKGPIPRELRPLMGNRIYGCDDCLAVCPWNKFAEQGREAKLAAREVLRAPKLAELARLDDAQFRTLFAKTSIKRTGRDRFVRNVLIAIGNSGDASLAGEAERLLDDSSPLVRGAAVWALRKLLPAEKFSALRRADADASAPRRCRRGAIPASRRVSTARRGPGRLAGCAPDSRFRSGRRVADACGRPQSIFW